MYEKLAYIGFASYCLGSIGVECVGGGECYDINGRTISPGFHFVPGPDTCTLCVCDNGNPKWCKAVLCSPPQDCKSFRVGNSCCEFICLDDTFGGGKGGEHDLASEFGLRLIAGAITAILCLSIVFFSIHRLRQRKIRGRQPSLHHHSHLAQVSHGGGDPHNSAGYLSGASVVSDGGDLRYAEDDDGGYLRPPHYTLWKPAAYAVSGHGGGMPRGHEAPPPYEEAVAAAQVEAAMAAAAAAAANSGSSFVHSSSHHMSEHRTIPLTLATSECLFPQPLRPSITHHRSDMPPLAPVAPQPQRGAIVDLAPMAPPHRGPVDSVPVAPPHRGTVDLAPVAPPHRGTVDLAPVAPPHRGAVDLAPVAPPHRGAAMDLRGAVAPPHCGTAVTGAKVAPLVLPPPPKVARHNVATCTSSCPTVAPSRRTTSNPQVAAPSSDAAIINCKPRPPPLLPTAAAPQTNNVGSPAVSVPTRLAPVAMSSIAEEGQEVEDDEEEEEEEEDDSDYRSECENCNVSVMRDESSAACFEVDDLETMTLHRKPPQDHLHCHLALHQRRLGGPVGSGGALGAPQGEWTSLTLPTNTRTQRPTSVLCNSSQTSARENWFSSMPQTSSESSEEEE